MVWWITLIWEILTNIPKIFSLVKSIIDLIRNIKDPKQRAVAITELKAAYQVAKQTGDATQLNQMHENLCNGVACASNIVKE